VEKFLVKSGEIYIYDIWSLAKERLKCSHYERSTFVHCRANLQVVKRVSEGSQGPGQLTPFGFRMFKIITRAKAIPAKSDVVTVRTRGKT
jgi:hypothetical protein